MFLWIADDGYADAQPCGRGTFGHRVRSVVRTFSVNIRAQKFKQRLDGGFTEEHDVINGSQSRDKLRTSFLVQNGPPGTFQERNARIVVDSDDQHVTFAARALKISDVPDVQSVKAAVRENNPFSFLFRVRKQFAKRFRPDDF